MACLARFLLPDKKRKVMKKLIILTFLLFIIILPTAVQGQSESGEVSKKEARKLKREAQKKQETIELQKSQQLVLEMVRDTNFVVEAHNVMSPNGLSIPVSASTNFFATMGRDIVIQLASNQSMGANGLGGVTHTGILVEYQVKAEGLDKPIEVSGKIRLNPGTGLIPFDLIIQSGNVAQFSVSSLGGDRIMLSGIIQDAAKSKVFMGTPYFR